MPVWGLFSADQWLPLVYEQLTGTQLYFNYLHLLSAPLAVWLYYRLLTARRLPMGYRALLAGFILAYAAFFSYSYLHGAAINLDSRHFRPLTLLLIPGIITWIGQYAKGWQYALALGWMCTAGYVLADFVQQKVHFHQHRLVGTHGFYSAISHGADLELLHGLDRAYADTDVLIYVTEPAIRLELPRARVMTDILRRYTADQLSARTFRGQPRELFLVLPRHLERPRREALHGSFADVGNFVVRAQGEQYVLWAGTPLKPDVNE